MAKQTQQSVQKYDPWAILGVSVQADDQEIRRRYLQKVKEYPPDRAPEQFERVRDAYENLRDPRRRSRLMLVAVDPQVELVSLLDDEKGARRFVGSVAWWTALSGKD